MRGKQWLTNHLAGRKGITPAHAGKTLYLTGGDERGEGSPPRMRGKPTYDEDFGRIAGITPAHAGKTCLSIHRTFSIRDHPRACGEN